MPFPGLAQGIEPRVPVRGQLPCQQAKLLGDGQRAPAQGLGVPGGERHGLDAFAGGAGQALVAAARALGDALQACGLIHPLQRPQAQRGVGIVQAAFGPQRGAVQALQRGAAQFGPRGAAGELDQQRLVQQLADAGLGPGRGLRTGEQAAQAIARGGGHRLVALTAQPPLQQHEIIQTAQGGDANCGVRVGLGELGEACAQGRVVGACGGRGAARGVGVLPVGLEQAE
ncbi:MAG: hypothetical protein KatS3mg126_2486 [Lysobacteraceae bacterium]|nr:MAG: hypothetical protein KatS3mg126_2486 [Xanthomonadaceae bacterium]